MGEDLYTLWEVATEFCVSYTTVKRWTETGKLRAVRLGPNLLRIPRSEIDRLLAQGSTHKVLSGVSLNEN